MNEDFKAFDFGIVAIAGVGLLGGSLGMAIRNGRLARHVLGIGRNPARLAQAISYGAVDSTTLDLEGGCAHADVIVLCTPVAQIIEDLPRVLAAAPSSAIVTDVGSVKGAIVEAAASDSRFVGGHPMAGSERAGVEAAHPHLFDQSNWALTPTSATSNRCVLAVQAMAQAVGASTLVLDPAVHDRAVALTSHLPHVLATTLMCLASDRCRDLWALPRMSAGSFADATRVAGSSPKLWRDISLENKDELLEAVRSYKDRLCLAIELLERSDASEIEEFFRAGLEAKSKWTADRES